MALIDELYSSHAVGLIRDLYHGDMKARQSFYQAFGNKILQSQEKILTSEPLSVLMFICCTAKFSSSEEESNQVAIILYKQLKESNPLPYVTEDRGLQLAEKCLVSLSLFYPAMMRRYKKGAPSPTFYRDYSKHLFDSNGFYEIADHHEKWENFLGEFFI